METVVFVYEILLCVVGMAALVGGLTALFGALFGGLLFPPPDDGKQPPAWLWNGERIDNESRGERSPRGAARHAEFNSRRPRS